MTDEENDFHSIEQERPAELSVKELHAKRFQPRSFNNTNKNKRAPLRVQVSKPSKNSVKLKPEKIPVHFQWALILTILCFFIIGPIWALYKTIQLRRMIQREELEAATRLSHKIASVLIFSTIVGIFAWVAILFCSVGIILTGELLNAEVI